MGIEEIAPDVGDATVEEKTAFKSIEERNINTVTQWFPQWYQNARLNGKSISDRFEKYGNRNAAYAQIPEGRDPEKVLICGSGVSLNKVKNIIHKWNGVLISGPSNASLLCANGRPPDYILAVDAAVDTGIQLGYGPYEDLGCKLITHPMINPLALEHFPKEAYFFKSFIPWDDEHDPWKFNANLTRLYDPVKNFMMQAGCCVNSEILFLYHMGRKEKQDFTPLARKVFLIGVDFSYPYDESIKRWRGRCDTYHYSTVWGPHPPWLRRKAWVGDPPHYMLTRSAVCDYKGKKTDDSMIGYMRSLYTVMRLGIVPLINACGETSLLEYLPEADIRQVIETQGECGKVASGKEYIRAHDQIMVELGLGVWRDGKLIPNDPEVLRRYEQWKRDQSKVDGEGVEQDPGDQKQAIEHPWHERDSKDSNE